MCLSSASFIDAADSYGPDGAAPSQIALAWVLRRSPVMLPIPGTSKVKHLEENVAAVDIQLSDEEYAALDRAAPNTPRLDAPHCLTGGGALPVSCP